MRNALISATAYNPYTAIGTAISEHSLIFFAALTGVILVGVGISLAIWGPGKLMQALKRNAK